MCHEWRRRNRLVSLLLISIWGSLLMLELTWDELRCETGLWDTRLRRELNLLRLRNHIAELVHRDGAHRWIHWMSWCKTLHNRWLNR